MAAHERISVRPIGPDGGGAFVEMMNRTYTRKKTSTYFEWQFFKDPEGAALLGAYAGTRLVGCFGIKHRRLSGGRSACGAVDLIVDEEYRGKGIFSLLAREAQGAYSNGADLFYSFTNDRGKAALEKSLGWKTVCTVHTLVASGPHDGVSQKMNICGADGYGWEHNDKSFENRTFFLRDDRELVWRFSRNPEYDYTVVDCGEGFAVVKVFTDPVCGERFGDIVEFGTEGGRFAVRRLLGRAAAYLFREGVSKVTAWAMPGSVTRSVLGGLGFRESDQIRHFLVGAQTEEAARLCSPDSWFFVESDAEIF
ncbi:MAG: GNAT family N-acetyltransferase [Spirochaetes bacterium]|nr:GNAT family N-acetyltransferase [Spirochaetota bacterium]